MNNFTTGQWLPATATINQRVSEGKWGWHSDIRLPHPHFLIYFWSDAQKRLWTSENEGLGPMGWLSITAAKSRVMSQRLNSSFISPHVSSSLSVLIVSIPKFDCRSLGLSQPSYFLIKYSTSWERKLYLHCAYFYFWLSHLWCGIFFAYQHAATYHILFHLVDQDRQR